MRVSSRLVKAMVPVLLWAVVLSLSAQEPEIVVLDEIVARVNDEIITLTDLMEELDILRTGLQRTTQNGEELEREFQVRKHGLLKNLIQNKMMLQRAEELGIAANIEVDVAAALERMRQEAGIPNMDVLDQYLRQQGSSLELYRQNLRERLIVDSLIQQFVYSKITLLTPEIEDFHKKHIARFTEPAQVHLKEILFLKEGKDIGQVRQQAETVMASLKSGASFEEMAKQHSEGPTASRGGDIGSFNQGSMNEEIENVVFGLEEGQFSEIIETDYGLQIVKLEGKTEPREKPLEEVRREITNALYQEKAQPGLKEFVDALLDETYVFVSEKYRQEFDVEF